jgi:hypothetical protein
MRADRIAKPQKQTTQKGGKKANYIPVTDYKPIKRGVKTNG